MSFKLIPFVFINYREIRNDLLRTKVSFSPTRGMYIVEQKEISTNELITLFIMFLLLLFALPVICLPASRTPPLI